MDLAEPEKLRRALSSQWFLLGQDDEVLQEIKDILRGLASSITQLGATAASIVLRLDTPPPLTPVTPALSLCCSEPGITCEPFILTPTMY